MDQQPSPLSRFTLAGRMLLLAHVLLGMGGTTLYICDFIPKFSAGRYPIFMFAVPVGLACIFSFLLFARTLERFGIKIYRN